MSSHPVRVAIVGVGNCAASLVQGVQYYKDADPQPTIPGLMHVEFGRYHVGDVQFVAAFDVDGKKVGQDLSGAILASESNTIKIAEVPPTGVTLQRGPTELLHEVPAGAVQRRPRPGKCGGLHLRQPGALTRPTLRRSLTFGAF